MEAMRGARGEERSEEGKGGGLGAGGGGGGELRVGTFMFMAGWDLTLQER